ncbi:MAG: Rieske 2Fe-2S domain-containing protein [Acidobacteriota bacterium]|nr:Rieske 2Fe-2S domain-containing protein [Acidobacteriota bacterium]
MSTEVKEDSKFQGCSACGKNPKYQQDFPIEWEGDHYVSRREMVKFLTLGSLLLAIANWVTAFARQLVRRDSSVVQLLGPASVLHQNGSMLFRYPTPESPCIAIRTPQGELVAYSQVCTHLSCAVVYDKLENQLACPCHRGIFNVDQGAPVAGPPTRPLPRVTIEQRGDQIFATGLEA